MKAPHGAVAAAAILAAGCGLTAEEAPIAGTYSVGAFHLLTWCPDLTPAYRNVDLLYPANEAPQTWRIDENGDRLTVTWDGVLLATGTRDGDEVELSFERLDPYAPPVDWTFRGHMRRDLRFHERTLVGRIEQGTRNGCFVLPRSVAWFTTTPRLDGRADVAPERLADARGDWDRFVWFLDVGPYAMTRKGDPGQRGRGLRLFSFASTGGGRITTGGEAAFFDNGFEENWLGAAQRTAATFAQPEEYWSLDYAQDVVWDDDEPDDFVGIRRVLAGFVTGSYRLVEQNYPPGWDGETGMLPLTRPGMAFWLDTVRPAPADADADADAFHAAPRVVARESGGEEGAAIVIEDGVIQ